VYSAGSKRRGGDGCGVSAAGDEIETDEDFALGDRMQELGCLELKALGSVKHGDIPQEGPTR
jgi:hypothetical protein